MKRNWSVIRGILLELEKLGECRIVSATARYNHNLLINAGWISLNGEIGDEANAFLSKIRNDSDWNEYTRRFSNNGLDIRYVPLSLFDRLGVSA